MVSMSNSLKINVITIPEEGLKYDISENGEWFKECFTDDEQADFKLSKVDMNCLITKTSSAVLIKGSLSATIKMSCGRCLEEVLLPVGADFVYTLVQDKEEIREEDLELKEEDLEISHYSGDFIDLIPIICEQIVLQVPIKALCSENCKGLCPHCGTNLNSTSCNCKNEHVDIRMAVLKNFRVKN
jgi:uncharacterized protein